MRHVRKTFKTKRLPDGRVLTYVLNEPPNARGEAYVTFYTDGRIDGRAINDSEIERYV